VIYKIVDENGVWQTDMRLMMSRRPGDRIPRGRDFLEVVEVRSDEAKPVLVVRSVPGSNSAA
jgi:hypothetical protein